MSAAIFDFYAQRHAGFLHGMGQLASDQLLGLLALQGSERTLEIGCGTGSSLVFLRHNFPGLSLTGADGNPHMLRKARQRLQFCGLAKQIPLLTLPLAPPYSLPDGTFDLIWIESVLAIQTSDSLALLLAEIWRLLAPGGRLALNETIWAERTAPSQIKAFNDKCAEYFGIIQANGEVPYRADWEVLLQRHGFTINQVQLAVSIHQPHFKTHPLSRAFNGWGKLRTKLAQGQEAQRLTKLQHKLHQALPVQLATYLFVAQKPLHSDA